MTATIKRTTRSVSLLDGEIVEENDLGSIRRVTADNFPAKLNRTLRSVNVAGWPQRRGRRSPRTPRGWGLPGKSADGIRDRPACRSAGTEGSKVPPP